MNTAQSASTQHSLHQHSTACINTALSASTQHCLHQHSTAYINTAQSASTQHCLHQHSTVCINTAQPASTQHCLHQHSTACINTAQMTLTHTWKEKCGCLQGCLGAGQTVSLSTAQSGRPLSEVSSVTRADHSDHRRAYPGSIFAKCLLNFGLRPDSQ